MVSAKKSKQRGRPETIEKTRPFQMRIEVEKYFQFGEWSARYRFKSKGEACRWLIDQALEGKIKVNR